MKSSLRRYCVITPCRDEARFARQTLEAVVNQTVVPNKWVIVDDGSTDGTSDIVLEYAAAHPFITLLTVADRGYRKLGGGVIDAFYTGYECIESSGYDFICKLDLDLVLPPRYFQALIERMDANPRLGVVSGKTYTQMKGRFVSERCGDEQAIGPSKFYRTTCFKEIGGFVRELGWDDIDGHRCRMLGWMAASYDDPDLRLLHLRPMGSSDRGWLTGRVRSGLTHYYIGTGFLYVLASAVHRVNYPPVVVGALAILWGYVKATIMQYPKYSDLEFRRFLHKYQRSCLIKGKTKATALLDQKQTSVWLRRSSFHFDDRE
jgi:glycosyltransferase involved in cell wall biosynthesis